MGLELKKVDHVALIVSDYEHSKMFYTEILGLEVLNEQYRTQRDSWKLDLGLDGEYVLELFSFPEPPARLTDPEAQGLRHIAFQVSDLDQTITSLQENNIEVEGVRRDNVRNCRFTFIKDPDGLPIEFCEIV